MKREAPGMGRTESGFIWKKYVLSQPIKHCAKHISKPGLSKPGPAGDSTNKPLKERDKEVADFSTAGPTGFVFI